MADVSAMIGFVYCWNTWQHRLRFVSIKNIESNDADSDHFWGKFDAQNSEILTALNLIFLSIPQNGQF